MKITLLAIFVLLSNIGVDNTKNTEQSLEIIGKYLFHGHDSLTAHKACVSCHEVELSDTFSWNPNAFEIAKYYSDTSMEAWEEAMMFPVSDRMFEDHDAYNFSENEFLALQAYLSLIYQNGAPRSVKNRTWQYLTYLLLLLIILIIVRLRYPVNSTTRWLLNLTLAIAFASLLVELILQSSWLGKQKNYEPDQALKFSHAIHSTQNKIDCIYCHASASKSAKAGFPANSICMNCHAVIQYGTNSGQFELRKLFLANRLEEPVQWTKVINLPSHIRFRHDVHTNLAEISCHTCHGDIENMNRVKQDKVFDMKWCLDCHQHMKVNSVSFVPDQVHSNIDWSKDSVSLRELGAWECNRCHH